MVSEVRFWATKYVVLSYLGGLNLAFFAWHFGIKNLKPYIGIPLTLVTFFLSRNFIMKNCMDKVYFPIAPLYAKMRQEEKRKEQLIKDARSLVLDKKSKLASDEDYQKNKLLT